MYQHLELIFLFSFRYQKNYTTPLASVDYMNPQTVDNNGLDDWSTIIPLIKGFDEDYADNR